MKNETINIGVPNIAFNKPTKPYAKQYNSGYAVDGDFYNTCSHTKKTWKVLLDGWYRVKMIAIQSTKTCYGMFFI